MKEIKKRSFLTLLLSMFFCLVYGQGDFKWSVSDAGPDEIVLTVEGALDKDWHVSMRRLQVERHDGLRAEGTLHEETHTDGDNGERVVYTQRFAVTEKEYHLKGYLQYMLCTDTKCLAPTNVEFEHRGGAAVARDDSRETAAVAEKPAAAPRDTVAKAAPAAASEVVTDSKGATGLLDSPAWRPVIDELKAFEKAYNSTPHETADSSAMGLVTLFLLAFGGGLLALLTPCVWPMIPLTVSFFMKRGEKRGEQEGDVKGAVLFGVCIVGIFLVMGVLLTLLFGADALNKLSTNAVFNVVCFAVLVLFGLSLLGLFELRLPSSWADALDRRSSATTGIVSIFLMALTMVVVSFSCTAPVMGLLLVEIASAATGGGSLLTPIVGMTGFALALALPFTLFALFPRLLKRVPKSGQWMMSVRVTLGFLELAFALKFLSVADLAYGWHILPRWLFLSIWIALAFACGVYHTVDWSRRKVNPLRKQKVAMVCYAFMFYLLPGLHGAPCTLVSAFLPPAENTEQTIYWDYDEARAEAKKQGKPLFIDFTGYGCVNCRKMEAAVFTDARVRDILYKDFVVLQLYVDDRKPLPEQMTVEGKILRTVGDKWALLEIHKFGMSSQPFYVITDAEGNPLSRSYAYNESVDDFIAWLGEWKKSR